MKNTLSRIVMAMAIVAFPVAVNASTPAQGDVQGARIPVSQLDIYEPGVEGGWIEGKGYFTVEDGFAVFSGE